MMTSLLALLALAPTADLERELKAADLPAVAAMALDGRNVRWEGVAGVRRKGAPERATLTDRWHLGSCTKAMTAYLCARLIDAGRLRWDMTLGEALGDQVPEGANALKDATLAQLLSHRSGAPFMTPMDDFDRPDGSTDRLGMARAALKLPLESPPGKEFKYSNLGYCLAGAMIEARTGRTWEENLRREVFRPLRMREVGFGNAGAFNKNNQPWPHFATGLPAPAREPLDNPRTMGPAGTVHASLRDWGRFGQEILRAAQGRSRLLKPETARRLTAPPAEGNYGYGWGFADQPWTNGPALLHGGSNTMNYCQIWIAPGVDRIYLAATNIGTDAARDALNRIIVEMIRSDREGGKS